MIVFPASTLSVPSSVDPLALVPTVAVKTPIPADVRVTVSVSPPELINVIVLDAETDRSMSRTVIPTLVPTS